MSPLRTAWERFWFAPEASVNLAAARIVISLHALWILCSRDLAALSGVPQEFWTDLQPGTSWRYLLFPGHPALESALQWATRATLTCAALGLYPRLCCLASGLLLYHLAPFESAFWTPAPYERGFTVSVLALTTLAFSRCGDALSIRGAHAAAFRSWEYGWPMRLIWLFFSQIYLASGVAKLLRVGWSWVAAENLRGWLLVMNQHDQVAVFKELGLWIAERPQLCWLIAAGALAFDLGFVAVVFSAGARRLLVPLAVVFHVGILLAMNIAFLNVPQLLIFVNWAALRRSAEGVAAT